MGEQLAIEEVEYWMELESLLARFHQDLDRVQETVGAIGEGNIQGYLMRAMDYVGAACCMAAAKTGEVGASVRQCA
jgi:hypothetical protein